MVHSGLLRRGEISSTFEAQNSLGHAGSLRRASVVAEFGAPSALSGNFTLRRMGGSAELQNAVTVQSDAILRRMTQSVSLAAASALSHAGQLRRAGLSAAMESIAAPATLSHVGNLRRSNLLAEFTAPGSMSHAGALRRSILLSDFTAPGAMSHAGAFRRSILLSEFTAPGSMSHVGNLRRGGLSAVLDLEEGGAVARSTPTYEALLAELGTTTAPRPGASVAGDILILIMFDFTAGSTITPPAGWTAFGPKITGPSFGARAAWKLDTGSDPTGYTFTVAGEDFACCFISRYRGVDTSDPIAGYSANGGSASPRSVPGLTLPNDNSRVILWSGSEGADISAAPAGMTFREDVFGSTAQYDQEFLLAGETGAKSHAQTGSNGWALFLIGLNGVPV